MKQGYDSPPKPSNKKGANVETKEEEKEGVIKAVIFKAANNFTNNIPDTDRWSDMFAEWNEVRPHLKVDSDHSFVSNESVAECPSIKDGPKTELKNYESTNTGSNVRPPTESICEEIFHAEEILPTSIMSQGTEIPSNPCNGKQVKEETEDEPTQAFMVDSLENATEEAKLADMYDTVIELMKWIPNMPELTALFVKWKNLKPKQKAKVDLDFDNGGFTYSYLYLAMKHALKRWSLLEDTDGVSSEDPLPKVFPKDRDWIEMLIFRINRSINRVINEDKIQQDSREAACASRCELEGSFSKKLKRKHKCNNYLDDYSVTFADDLQEDALKASHDFPKSEVGSDEDSDDDTSDASHDLPKSENGSGEDSDECTSDASHDLSKSEDGSGDDSQDTLDASHDLPKSVDGSGEDSDECTSDASHDLSKSEDGSGDDSQDTSDASHDLSKSEDGSGDDSQQDTSDNSDDLLKSEEVSGDDSN